MLDSSVMGTCERGICPAVEQSSPPALRSKVGLGVGQVKVAEVCRWIFQIDDVPLRQESEKYLIMAHA